MQRRLGLLCTMKKMRQQENSLGLKRILTFLIKVACKLGNMFLVYKSHKVTCISIRKKLTETSPVTVQNHESKRKAMDRTRHN